MTNNRSRQRGRRERRQDRQYRHQQLQHNLDLVEYLDALADTRAAAEDNLSVAGEQALKILDNFLADLARSLGMQDDKASMGDSLRYLERLDGLPREIAGQADRFRDTRNALFHNPDIMLRPEAGEQIIDGVEVVIRMASRNVRDLTRHSVVTASLDEPIASARDRMLDHGYDQLVVVDDNGGIVDLLTDRDIVVLEARDDIDGSDLTVNDAIETRDYRAVVILSTGSAPSEAVAALRDERIGAVVLTSGGNVGQPPEGIITRGDLLRSL